MQKGRMSTNKDFSVASLSSSSDDVVTNLFGPNVIVFDSSSMSIEYIQNIVDTIYKQQVNNEMGTERYCIMFAPGIYGTIDQPLFIKIGYYTEIIGLGYHPNHVIIYGKIEVYNRCYDVNQYKENGTFVVPTQPEENDEVVCFALNNFWRSLSNLSIYVVDSTSCTTTSSCTCNTNDKCANRSTGTTMFWAVSQATSMRRVDICNGMTTNDDDNDNTLNNHKNDEKMAHVTLSLMDYSTQSGYASGGYIANTRIVNGTIISGSQQQFLTRNVDIVNGTWEGSVWNQLLLGVTGAPTTTAKTNHHPKDNDHHLNHRVPSSNHDCYSYTNIEKNPISREKPYLYICNDTGLCYVCVPNVSYQTSGITWSKTPSTSSGSSNNHHPTETLIPLSDFFIVRPSSSSSKNNNNIANEINTALRKQQKHILFTPGVYDIDQSIIVTNTDCIILGLGFATITACNGCIPLIIADTVPGIVVVGIIIDAGPTIQSDVLFQVGTQRQRSSSSNNFSIESTNPITVSDVYFRVGGPHVGKVDVCFEINCDNVLVDHIWVWRADHGIEQFSMDDGTTDHDQIIRYEDDDFYHDTLRWNENIGRTGVVVNGNHVTCTGLFVEHFQEYNVVWNGNYGQVYFFQNELAYDVPTQMEWMTSNGTFGYAGYKVNDYVTHHTLLCAGVYVYNRNNPTIVTTNGFEIPVTATNAIQKAATGGTTSHEDDDDNNEKGKINFGGAATASSSSGIRLYKLYTVNLNGPGTISSVVNGMGMSVHEQNKGIPSYAFVL